MEIFYNTINVFSVTSDQFNASLINESMNDYGSLHMIQYFIMNHPMLRTVSGY